MSQKTTTSPVRQNFHQETEDGLNKQINMELLASYTYLAMAFHFERSDVALPGFHRFFKKQSEDERHHAMMLMEYLNKRGGNIVLADIAKPSKRSWDSPLEAMQDALSLEKQVNQALLDLHSIGSSHNDANFCDFIESEFLTEQVDSIRELAGYVTRLKRVGPGLGEYMFDNETLGE